MTRFLRVVALWAGLGALVHLGGCGGAGIATYEKVEFQVELESFCRADGKIGQILITRTAGTANGTSELRVKVADVKGPLSFGSVFSTDELVPDPTLLSPEGLVFPSQLSFVAVTLYLVRDTTGSFTLNVTSVSEGRLSERFLWEGTATCIDPPLLPENDSIVFANTPPDTSVETDSEIWVLDAAGARRLTDNSVEDTDPAWSSTRSEIAFLRLKGSRWVVMVMDADGSNQTEVADFDPDTALHPAWSPTGRKIAVSVGPPGLGTSDIRVIDLEKLPGSMDRERRLTTGGDDDQTPTWHPDGLTIAFARNSAIYTVAADGTSAAPTLLYEDPFLAPAAPHWGPFGFVFQAYNVTVHGYRIARIDGTGAGYSATTSGGTHIADLAPKWSADSTRVLFVRESALRDGSVRLRVGEADVPNSDSEVPGQPDGNNTDPDW